MTASMRFKIIYTEKNRNITKNIPDALFFFQKGIIISGKLVVVNKT